MQALQFKGNGFEYFRIWIVNIFLTVITFTLYYPWAKVRNRRYFYANTTLDDRNFEYHATGKQLFVGYLIAMAILVSYLISQQLSPNMALFLFAVFIFGFPWIIWRSIIFNMRMTSFSNVRFSFEGSLANAYISYLLMPVLFFASIYLVPVILGVIAATLGEALGFSFMLLALLLVIAGAFLIAYVFGHMKVSQSQYIVNSLQYGQGRFANRLKASEFSSIALKTIGLYILAFIVYLLFVAVLAMVIGVGTELFEVADKLNDEEAINEEAINDVLQSGSVIALLGIFYIGFIVISILVFSYSFVRQRAYIFANSRLDKKIKFASTLQATSLAWVSISNFLLVVLTLGLAIPWAKVRMARYILEHTLVDVHEGIDDYVSQQKERQSSLGEQIGDAFDVDVGLGF